jgi:hypothetical protein
VEVVDEEDVVEVLVVGEDVVEELVEVTPELEDRAKPDW